MIYDTNMFHLSQIASKENILQKLNFDLWNKIDGIILKEQNDAAIIIQKYIKKYFYKNFVPNFIKYVEGTYFDLAIPSDSYYKMLNRYEKLNLKRLDCFNIATKCKCCDIHTFVNIQMKDLGFEDSIDYYVNLNLTTNCTCECSQAATVYCVTCFDD